MNLPDGEHHFNNVSDPPEGWTGTEENDVLTTSRYGVFDYDEESGWYIAREVEPPAEQLRLFVFPDGNFVLLWTPPVSAPVVGTWV